MATNCSLSHSDMKSEYQDLVSMRCCCMEMYSQLAMHLRSSSDLDHCRIWYYCCCCCTRQAFGRCSRVTCLCFQVSGLLGWSIGKAASSEVLFWKVMEQSHSFSCMGSSCLARSGGTFV